MGQNRSSAVMQQRAEPHDSLDDFPTPPWAGRALIEHVIAPLDPLIRQRMIWEPACNRGYLARGLASCLDLVAIPAAPALPYFMASDIFDYGHGFAQGDFLMPVPPGGFDDDDVDEVHWVITNPPFRLAEQFIARALKVASIGCAMLVRTSFLEGAGRYRNLYLPTPPTVVAQFVERVPMVKGRCDPKASSATSYAWLVWMHGEAPRPFHWIPPCRKRLERAGDYELATYGAHLLAMASEGEV